MVLTAHFIDDDWVMHKRIINFRPIHSHRGVDIGRALLECINGWGIKNVMTMTVDNIASNDKALEYLLENLPTKYDDGKHFHETDIQEKEQKEKPKTSKTKHGMERTKGLSCAVDLEVTCPGSLFRCDPFWGCYNLDVLPYFFPANPLDSLAKIISSTLLFPPSCIKSKLAIPHLSQVSSMAEILSKEAQAASPRDEDFGYK
ncbi:zinc finger BED domain-containing protein RICESLEEPER 2 [Tanacetum coccineum]